MDKSLDEIIGAQTASAHREPAGSSSNGVSKSTRSRRSRSSKKGPGGGGAGPAGSRGSKAVYIRNLSDDISEADLRDLFRQIGPVVRVVVDRDQQGSRTGLAWVLYDFAEDALVASERYNQRRAAGKVITVRRVAHVGDTGSGQKSLGDRIGAGSVSSGSKRSRRRRGGAEGAAKKEDSARSKTRTSADLDAELDAYMQVESSVPLSSAEGGSSAPAAPATGSGEASSAAAPNAAAPAAVESKPEDSMIDV